MLRLLLVLLLGATLCAATPAMIANEREREARDKDRAAQRAERQRIKREKRAQAKREREKRKKESNRKPKKLRAEETPGQPEPSDPEDPRQAEPSPPRPAEQPQEQPAPLPAPEEVELEKPNFDQAAQDAADFALQGEYLGELTSGPLAGRAGLQVVALGDGKFDVYVLRGGLPGNGWLRGSQRPKLSGTREEDRLVASGDVGRIEIDGASATVFDTAGQPLGVLAKVLRRSPTLGAAPAWGAKVLFNGDSTDAFQSAKLTSEGWLGVGALTKAPVGDFHMHLEFRTPFEPQKRGQGRGNSGIYIQERYEVQVLDSFGLAGEFNECGSLYRQRKPDFNLCLPPMSWQTYDIHFRAARFDAHGNKIANARITVFHNGIAVHDNVELTGKTGAGRNEEPTLRPIRFQDHGNAVVFRNIWIVPGQGSTVVDSACCSP